MFYLKITRTHCKNNDQKYKKKRKAWEEGLRYINDKSIVRSGEELAGDTDVGEEMGRAEKSWWGSPKVLKKFCYNLLHLPDVKFLKLTSVFLYWTGLWDNIFLQRIRVRYLSIIPIRSSCTKIPKIPKSLVQN